MGALKSKGKGKGAAREQVMSSNESWFASKFGLATDRSDLHLPAGCTYEIQPC